MDRPEASPLRLRRALLRGVAVLGLSAVFAGLWRGSTRAQPSHGATVAALKVAFQRETDAHRRYVAYSRKAREDGYRGIAYLFAAFATSEGVHARNFRALLAELGAEVEPGPTQVAVGKTRDNLIAAANDEIDSIDNLYPRTLERLKPEGHARAMTLVGYAWESERQHRTIIGRIQRFSPTMFESVASVIDDKTGQYFVCDGCGATSNRASTASCPVCRGPAEGCRKVPVPA